MPNVVSVTEKAHLRRQVGIRKASESKPLTICRNILRRHQNRGVISAPGRAWRVPAYWPGGVRHGGGASLICGFCMEPGKVSPRHRVPHPVRQRKREHAKRPKPQGAEYRRGARWRTGS